MMLDKREDVNQLQVIEHKYAFDRPINQQYLLYINDVSPFSFHSKDKDAFTSLTNGKYTYLELFSLSKLTFVVKVPYLRESFANRGMPVTLIIRETFKNTFVFLISS